MVLLYKRYHALKDQGAKARNSLDLSMPTRILAFGFYLSIALRFVKYSPFRRQLGVNPTGTLSLSLLSITSPESPVPDIMIATGVLQNRTSGPGLMLTSPISCNCSLGYFWHPKSRRYTYFFRIRQSVDHRL